MPRQRDQELLREVGKRVAQARQKGGFTQEQLAELLNIQPVSLSRLETGHRALSLSTLHMISKTVGVPLGDLLDESRDLPLPEHSPEEMELLRLFAGLSPSQQDVLLRLARELSTS
jgi:transcriptional regulator with XRE-family HTH domain